MSHESVSNKPLIRHVNRQQMSWRAVDVEQLISEDHPARAIWALVGRLDLRRFYENIESSAEEGGRPAIDPQLLISLWVYAYSRGIGSAREIERRCEYDPAFQWLTGIEPVNYHTLADFRVEQGKELHQLFSDLLGVLSAERLITLEEVMQDGTKIQAQASGKTFRREKTLREHVERARLQVEALRDPLAEPAVNRRQQAARERASREKRERLEQALVELEKLREPKKTAEEKRETRTSTSDPEARVMKQAGGGFAPSYNAQISTDGKHGLIVAVDVTQAGNDCHQLAQAAEQIEQRCGRKPLRMVADAGYTSRENIQELAEKNIDFVGAWRPMPPKPELTNSGLRRRNLCMRLNRTATSVLRASRCSTKAVTSAAASAISNIKRPRRTVKTAHCERPAAAAIKSTADRLCAARRVR